MNIDAFSPGRKFGANNLPVFGIKFYNCIFVLDDKKIKGQKINGFLTSTFWFSKTNQINMFLPLSI